MCVRIYRYPPSAGLPARMAVMCVPLQAGVVKWQVIYVLQCVAASCSELQRVTAWWSVLPYVAVRAVWGWWCPVADSKQAFGRLQRTAPHCNTLQHTAMHCKTLQHTARHCNTHKACASDSVVQSGVVWCIVLLCVTVCYSVLQCVPLEAGIARWYRVATTHTMP